MEQMNKEVVSNYKHNKNVKRNRRLSLKNEYLEGLIIDNNLSVDKYYEERLNEINDFYQEKINVLNTIKVNVDKNHEK